MVLRTRLLFCSALVAACAACATAGSPARQTASARTPANAYGLFLSGQVAMNSGDVGQASSLFDRAARTDPSQRAIRERAFMTALLSGDVERAARIAPTDAGPPAPLQTAVAVAPADTPEGRRAQLVSARTAQEAGRSSSVAVTGRLTRAVDALARGDGTQARTLLAGDLGQHDAVAVMLRPFAAAAAGDWTAALAVPEAGRQGEATLVIRNVSRAMLLERHGDRALADAAYEALAPDGSALTALARGEHLERTGRAPEAVAVYDRALAGGEQTVIRVARDRAASGGRAPAIPTIQQGAARAVLLPGVALSSARQHEPALIYFRLALRLDPTMDETLVLAGDSLAALRDEVGARRAYATVPATSPIFGLAQGKLISSLQRTHEDAEALRLARLAVAQAPADSGVKLTLASVLLDQRLYPEAIATLDQVNAPNDWRVLYARGIALERAGRWPEAETQLQAALRIHPDDPELLNFLGYAWVDRGLHVTEAAAMLDRAMQEQPESGAIVDSVGWARYRLGRYQEALGLLERATQLSPEDADVNNHLGDVYWRLNRRVEADYQWRRVLTLNPDPDLRARVTAKIASGTGPTDTPVAPTPAPPAPAQTTRS